MLEICFRSVQPGRGAHYGDPWGERCLQLSRRVPRWAPSALRSPMGEEGRRCGTISDDTLCSLYPWVKYVGPTRRSPPIFPAFRHHRRRISRIIPPLTSTLIDLSLSLSSSSLFLSRLLHPFRHCRNFVETFFLSFFFYFPSRINVERKRRRSGVAALSRGARW